MPVFYTYIFIYKYKPAKLMFRFYILTFLHIFPNTKITGDFSSTYYLTDYNIVGSKMYVWCVQYIITEASACLIKRIAFGAIHGKLNKKGKYIFFYIFCMKTF